MSGWGAGGASGSGGGGAGGGGGGVGGGGGGGGGIYVSSHLLSEELVCPATAPRPLRFNIAAESRLEISDELKQHVEGAAHLSVGQETNLVVAELLHLERIRNAKLLAANRATATEYWEALQKHRQNVLEKRSGASTSAPPPLRPTNISTIMSVGSLPSFVHDFIDRGQLHTSPVLPFSEQDSEAHIRLSTGLNMNRKTNFSVKKSPLNQANFSKLKSKKIGTAVALVSRKLIPALFPGLQVPATGPVPAASAEADEEADEEAEAEADEEAEAGAEAEADGESVGDGDGSTDEPSGGKFSRSGSGGGGGGDDEAVAEAGGKTGGNSHISININGNGSTISGKNSKAHGLRDGVLKRPAMVIPVVLKLPRSISWVRTQNNVIGQDVEVLRYIPYFGEDDGFWGDSRLEFALKEHFGKILDEIEAEINSEALETAILWLGRKYGGPPKREESSPNAAAAAAGATATKKAPRLQNTDSQTNGAGNNNSSVAASPVHSSVLSSDDDSDSEAAFISFLSTAESIEVYTAMGISRSQFAACYGRCSTLCSDREKAVPYKALIDNFTRRRIERSGNAELLSLMDPGLGLGFYSNEYKCPSGLGIRNKNEFGDLASNFRDLFCRVCFVYDCLVHGPSLPMPFPKKKEPFLPLGACFEMDVVPVDPVDQAIATGDFVVASQLARGKKSIRRLGGTESQKEGVVVDVTVAAAAGEVEKRASPAADADADADGDAEAADSSSNEEGPATKKRACLGPTAPKVPGLLDFYHGEGRWSGRAAVRTSQPQGVWPGFDEEEERNGASSSASSFVSAVFPVLQAPTTLIKSWQNAPAVKPELYSSLLSGTRPNDGNLLDVEKSLLREFATMYGGDIETIAMLLGTRSVSTVKRFLKDEGLIEEDDGTVFCKPCDENFTKVVRKSAAHLDRKMTAHNKGAVKACTPCNHEGDCKESNCSCIEKRMFCEKFCSCDFGCKHKFKGCRCDTGCRSKSCPCFAASRECDPDLCGKCGAGIRNEYLKETVDAVQNMAAASSDAAADALLTKARGCKNTSIRRGLGKHTRVGMSEVHGWGLFLLEPALKDDLIIEYVGEIISQPEADRRGVIYDKQGLSYLFNISDESVVDATRVGNNAKFVNHESEATSNLYPKVFLVDGDYHVGFYAKKAILPDTELTFNYGYADDVAPSWVGKLSKFRQPK